MVFHYYVVTLDILLAALGLFIIKRLLCARRQAPLPPGPRGLPFIGNVLDMPSEKEWLTFAQWGDVWGMQTAYWKLFVADSI